MNNLSIELKLSRKVDRAKITIQAVRLKFTEQYRMLILVLLI